MLIESLILTSALAASSQATPPPRATPETRPPAPIQEPAGRTASPAAAAVPAADVAFVKKAAAGGTTEVELAKLAQQKAEHADVKAFAAKLESDHTAANRDLKELASSKHITLAEAPSHGALHAKLEKLSGAAFDKAYVAAMVDDHVKDVKAFEKVANGSGDSDIKAFAAKTLPTLQEHLKMAQTTDAAVRKTR